MIKALIDTPARGPLVILGLSDLNVERLQDGQPILVDLADLGLPAQLVSIVVGRTEDSILADIERELGRPAEHVVDTSSADDR